MTYECHITLVGDADKIESIVKESGWFFSKIDHDPLLGSGIKCYATKHFPKGEALGAVIDNVVTMAAIYSWYEDCTVVRQKVEQIMYDTKEIKSA